MLGSIVIFSREISNLSRSEFERNFRTIRSALIYPTIWLRRESTIWNCFLTSSIEIHRETNFKRRLEELFAFVFENELQASEISGKGQPSSVDGWSKEEAAILNHRNDDCSLNNVEQSTFTTARNLAARLNRALLIFLQPAGRFYEFYPSFSRTIARNKVLGRIMKFRVRLRLESRTTLALLTNGIKDPAGRTLNNRLQVNHRTPQ